MTVPCSVDHVSRASFYFLQHIQILTVFRSQPAAVVARVATEGPTEGEMEKAFYELVAILPAFDLASVNDGSFSSTSSNPAFDCHLPRTAALKVASALPVLGADFSGNSAVEIEADVVVRPVSALRSPARIVAPFVDCTPFITARSALVISSFTPIFVPSETRSSSSSFTSTRADIFAMGALARRPRQQGHPFEAPAIEAVCPERPWLSFQAIVILEHQRSCHS